MSKKADLKANDAIILNSESKVTPLYYNYIRLCASLAYAREERLKLQEEYDRLLAKKERLLAIIKELKESRQNKTENDKNVEN